MIKFWILFSGLFAFTWWIAYVNNRLLSMTAHLIPWLDTTLKPMINDHDERNLISKEIVPMLEKWYMQSAWFGLLTFVMQIVLFMAAGFMMVSTNLPYIIIVAVAILFATVVVGTHQTIVRRTTTREISGYYYLAYIELITKLESEDGKATGTIGDS